MTEYNPDFVQLHVPIVYDHSIERLEIDENPCSKTDQNSLNSANGQLKFNNKGNFLYRLSSPNTGILFKYQFRTRDNNNTDRNAEISLSNNFIGHIFSKVTLTIGGQIVEEINFPGILMDTLYHTEEIEFRNYSGELLGFIPDDSDIVSDTIGTRQGDIAGNDAAAVVGSANQAANKIIKTNNDFNKGYCRRKKLYNYTVQNNDDIRRGEIFIPLNRIFGFCAEVDKVLRYIPFQLEFIRTANNTNCFFGAANTNYDNFGITSMTLHLEILNLNPSLTVSVEKELGKTLEFAYLRRICEEKNLNQQLTSTFTKEMGDNEGNPRYIFCIFKSNVADTAQTNYTRCVHGNIQSITVKYAGNTYPHLTQNANWSNNEFSKFYKDFIDVSRALGTRNPGLSMAQYRDLYTIYAIDLSGMPISAKPSTLTINVKRNSIPQNNDDLKNPQDITMYVIIISETRAVIDCTKGTARVEV